MGYHVQTRLEHMQPVCISILHDYLNLRAILIQHNLNSFTCL